MFEWVHEMSQKQYALGIDIGGTFTDVVLYDQDEGSVFSHKELTTPDEPTTGALRGVQVLLAREGVTGDQISRVVHATTLFTNALIERRGAKTGLITTKGFRDTLEMRREFKYDLYDLFIELPSPLVPRALRMEVQERMRPNGEVDTPLDEEGVLRAARALVEQGAASIAIVFLHAYANGAHERRARELIEAAYPGLYVSVSCEVAPQIREYERTSTTAANAYVRPIADRYLASMVERLAQISVRCPFLMMLSNGGLTHVDEARRFPIQLLESGPAAGAIAAAYFSKRSGINSVLAFDMGGTTAKMSIVRDNAPLIAHQFEAGREKRFAAGSGLPINISTVELIEIGAGGGSIAHLDSLGLLKVGPQSASSKPGPACYARGGTRPTVTDANLLLGHLDPESFAGGTMRLSTEAADTAMHTVSVGLGMDEDSVSAGILAVVNENMAAAARVHVAERGFDVPAFSLLVTGGGGPLHGCDVARRLGIRRMICPPGAGVASAIGLLMAPARVDRSATMGRALEKVGHEELESAFAALERDAATVMAETLSPGTPYTLVRSADICFAGQGFEVITRLPDGPYGPETAAQIRSAFAEGYRQVFGQVPPVQSIEIVNLRLTAQETRVYRPLSLDVSGKHAWVPRQSCRDVWSEPLQAFVSAPVLSRDAMTTGQVLHGPVIVEDASSTLVVPADASVMSDAAGNLIIDLGTAFDAHADAAVELEA